MCLGRQSVQVCSSPKRFYQRFRPSASASRSLQKSQALATPPVTDRYAKHAALLGGRAVSETGVRVRRGYDLPRRAIPCGPVLRSWPVDVLRVEHATNLQHSSVDGPAITCCVRRERRSADAWPSSRREAAPSYALQASSGRCITAQEQRQVTHARPGRKFRHDQSRKWQDRNVSLRQNGVRNRLEC